MKASLVATICFAMLCGVFSFISYIRYWEYAEEIEQVQSSYLAPDGANLTSGGIIWTVPAGFFGLLTIGSLSWLVFTFGKPKQSI